VLDVLTLHTDKEPGYSRISRSKQKPTLSIPPFASLSGTRVLTLLCFLYLLPTLCSCPAFFTLPGLLLDLPVPSCDGLFSHIGGGAAGILWSYALKVGWGGEGMLMVDEAGVRPQKQLTEPLISAFPLC
jgi:hypothetical protein